MTHAAPTEPPAPDRRAFEAQLGSARFLAGVERGDWRVVSYAWPTVVVEVAAAPRDHGPEAFALRCDVSGYSSTAPTATPWDVSTGAVLNAARRPKGERVGMVFRTDWENGTALYAPFDRVALQGHPGWRDQHPRHTWDASRDFTWFLERVFDLLNNDDYVGI
jgi:hypothetical protein